MQPGQRTLARLNKVLQRLNSGFILPLEHQALRCLPPPGVRTFQVRNQLSNGSFPKLWTLPAASEIRGSESIDSPHVAPAFEIDPLTNVVGNRPGMLDHFTIHIEHMQGPIRR